MRSGKKPIHLAMAGGRLPRQRMWEALRELAKGGGELSTYKVARRSGQDDEAVRDYLRALAKAKIVRQVEVNDRDGAWELLKDEGVEAPRINKRGERMAPEGVECIWRALRIVGEQTAAEAAEQARAGGAKITEDGARIYLQGLALAGYVVRDNGTPGKPSVFRLLPGRNSGPLHPIYQRNTFAQVYDPNLDQVVWTKGQPVDAAEVSGLRIENEQLRAMLRKISARGLSPVLTEQELTKIDSLVGKAGDA